MHIDPGDFTPEALAAIAPTCSACHDCTGIQLVGIDRIYPHRQDLRQREDGSTPFYWLCVCGAYCGAHRDSLKPFGTPADLATRRARQDAHAAFDPLWERKMRKEGISKTKARGQGYKWLREQLGMEASKCHIGEMTAADARRVVDVCRNWKSAA
jgi:zinc-finger-containing domain